jgi:hypothetical protein
MARHLAAVNNPCTHVTITTITPSFSIFSSAYSSSRVYACHFSLLRPWLAQKHWLADVFAAGSDLEPPPHLESSVEYLQKPRRPSPP